MTKWDKLIIVGLLVFSFIPHMSLIIMHNKPYDIAYATVRVDGEIKQQIPLTGQVNSKHYEIKTEYGQNNIIVKNEQIAVEEADCPDQVCRQVGFVHQPHESIVCLPNHLYIEIVGNVEKTDDIDIRPY